MKLILKHIGIPFFIALVFFIAPKANAQRVRGPYDTIRVYGYITPQGDTIPMSYLPSVTVTARMPKQWKNYWADWTRLRNAVYVTYPYAISASRVMNEINAKLAGVTDKKERKKIIHSREKELRKAFSDKITNLSVYQGKVLMKLINRQTGNNCYEIIDEYKGSFTAAMYQTVAVLFGSSLKQAYDSNGQDRDMEKIVLDVQKMYGYKG